MFSFLKVAPLLAALIATPSLAQPASPHMGPHHQTDGQRPTKAPPDAKGVDDPGCPMSDGHMADGHMTDGRVAGGPPMSGQQAAGAHGPRGAHAGSLDDHMRHCPGLGDKDAKPAAPKPDQK